MVLIYLRCGFFFFLFEICMPFNSVCLVPWEICFRVMVSFRVCSGLAFVVFGLQSVLVCEYVFLFVVYVVHYLTMGFIGNT